MLLLVMGGIYSNNPMMNSMEFVDYAMAGYIGIAIAYAGLMNLPSTLCSYRERKILKRFQASPFPPGSMLAAQFVVNAGVTAVSVALLLIIGRAAFHGRFLWDPLEFLFAVLLTLAAMFSVGFLIASLIRDLKTANTIAFFIYFPTLMLSGATIPFDIMPHSLRMVSRALPLTYGIHLVNSVGNGNGLAQCGVDIAVLALTCVAATVVSLVTFRWE
jgi:ABC-2 type transport system permease protein